MLPTTVNARMLPEVQPTCHDLACVATAQVGLQPQQLGAVLQRLSRHDARHLQHTQLLTVTVCCAWRCTQAVLRQQPAAGDGCVGYAGHLYARQLLHNAQHVAWRLRQQVPSPYRPLLIADQVTAAYPLHRMAYNCKCGAVEQAAKCASCNNPPLSVPL